MRDLRPSIPRKLFGRSFGHLTPNYIFYKLKLVYTNKRFPTYPSLTLDSIRLLEQLLKPTDVGVEWGAGNSTGWFAERTKHLISFETNPEYFPIVKESLKQRGLDNVQLNFVPFEYFDDEQKNHEHEWMKRANGLADESIDYALVDSAPRSCLCKAAISKLKRGGILILDNANWYLPPPDSLTPFPVSSVGVALGFPGSKAPENQCFPSFLNETSEWRRIWTSDGVSATLLLFKP